MEKPTYDLEERLLQFAADIIHLVEQLPESRAGKHVANHLLRSGSSPLPNHGEAQTAEENRRKRKFPAQGTSNLER